MKVYRVEDKRYSTVIDADSDHYGSELCVNVLEFDVIKTTPCGLIISTGFGSKRFINLNAKKQYAHLLLSDAYEAFFARKQKQLKILTNQLHDVEQAIQKAKFMQGERNNGI